MKRVAPKRVTKPVKVDPKKTTRKPPVRKVKAVQPEKVEVSPWRIGLTPEIMHEKIELEKAARLRGSCQQIAPNISRKEFEDFKKKFPQDVPYLLGEDTDGVTLAKARNASIKS